MQKFDKFLPVGNGADVLRPQNAQGDDQDGVHHHTGADAHHRGDGVGAVGGVTAGEGPVHEAVHRPGGAAHEDGGQDRLCEQLDIVGLLRGVLPHEEQVQPHDDHVTAQGGDGRAVDVDIRIPHQDIVHHDFRDAAGDDGEDGNPLLAVGL